MSAVYPDIYIRPKGTVIADLDLVDGLTTGWTQCTMLESGAKWSVEPGLIKRLSKGQQRVLSEVVNLSATVAFVDAADDTEYTGTSGADGVYRIPVPIAKGPYTVRVVKWSLAFEDVEDVETTAAVEVEVDVEGVFSPALYTWVATDGNDTSGDGTFDAPYATMAKAESLTLTGTKAIIYVKPGTYTEAHEFSKAYTWRAYGEVTLRNTGTSQVIKGKAGTANNWTLDGFIIDGQTIAGIMVNLSTGAAGTVTIKDCGLINPKSTAYGIDVNNAASPTIIVTGCTMTGNCNSWVCDRSNSGTPYTSNITVTGCTISGNCGYVTIRTGDATSGTTAGSATLNVTNNTITCNNIHDIIIGKSGTYTITGNTFTFPGNKTNNYGVVRVNRGINMTADVTGTIVFSNNTVMMGAYKYTGSAVFDYALSAAKYGVTCNNNTITGSATDYDKVVIMANNPAAFTCEGNLITLAAWTAASKAVIQYKQETFAATGVVSISYNTIRTKQNSGYVIACGPDTPGTQTHDLASVRLIGNLIYGSTCYGVTPAGNTCHTIFSGYFKDTIIARNYLIGCGHGLIIEHNNETEMAAGAGIFNNVAIDCFTGVVAGGADNVRVYGNTIVNRIANCSVPVTIKWNDTMTGITWDEENPTPVAGAEIKNNIIYSINGSYQLISISDHASFASGGCDYNALFTDIATLGRVAGTNKTIAEWTALGYDAHSLWDDGACVAPELADIAAATAMDEVDVTPTAGANVIAAGANLGTDYDDAIASGFSVPVTADDIKEQPSEGDWTIGAVIE